MRVNVIKKLITASMFAALTCVATMVFHIPTLAGYTNLGDGFVLLGAFVLGPVYGFAAGGLGSMLADILTSYAYYAPGTLVIKGCSALFTALLLKKLYQKGKEPTMIRLALCALPGELFMVAGYFGYKAVILGRGMAAVPSIWNNCGQAVVGILISIIIFRIFYRVPELRKRISKN